MSGRTDRAPRGQGLAERKILFLNRFYHPDESATSQLLTDLTRSLAETGFDVHVICSRLRYDDATIRLEPQESIAGVAIHRVWTSRFGRQRLPGRALDYATFYVSSALAMIRMLKRDDTVIAKTDPPLISVVAMAAAKLKGAHLVNWLQDVFPEVASLLGVNPLPRFLDALLRRCRDLSLHAAYANIVLGERMADQLQRNGIPRHKIQIIENWAELSTDKPKPAASSALRSRLGLQDHFVVGYSGNLGRAHEFDTLLGAAELLKRDARFVFLMIGGGAGMMQLADEVGRRGLTSFRFLPYQPRESLADCLAAADVHWVSLRPVLEGLIVPSKFYGILAAARPVIFIGDPDGELAREIRRCACGITLQVGESEKLSRLLMDWQSNPKPLEAMGEAGCRHYGERYSAARAFDQWIQVFKLGSRVADVSPRALSNR